VEIVSGHPVVGPRYGSAIDDLREVWLSQLGREAFRASVFEDSEDSHIRIVGSGVSAFVSDEFLLALKTPPFRWLGPELIKRLMDGASPLLSDKQVREANATGGLNLVTWEGALRPQYLDRVEANAAIFAAFVELHRGFLLKELIANATTPQTLEGALRSGGLLVDANGQYTDRIEKPLHEVLAEPHYLGLTRDLALCRFGTWIGSLFVYQAPQFGFRRSEQRLLLAALRGGTDQQLAKELAISLSAVKKAWLSIYARVSAHFPELVPGSSQGEEFTPERGKEKKQRLLAYLREHPEELRPASPQ
jgi:DNA-binding CsgD family transcriptional regulator